MSSISYSMDSLSNNRPIKVAPFISYVPYESNPNPNTLTGKDALSKLKASTNNVRSEIEDEAVKRAIIAQDRYKIYRDILLNQSEKDIPYRFAFYSLSCILLSIATTSIILLIPVHNVLEEPQYWWEIIIQALTGFVPVSCAYTLLNCSYWTNIGFLKGIKNFLMYYLVVFIFMGVFAVSISMGWSYGLKMPSPAPFYGLVVAYITLIFGFIPLWYLFPPAWRKEKDIRRKFKFFLLAIAVNFAVTLIYTMYTKAFIKAPLQYQWVVAIFLIPLREFNLWLQIKAGYKTAGVQDDSISNTCGHNINNRHCFFLAVILGTVATDVTCWVILTIDVSINMYLLLKIAWTKWKKGINEKNEAYMIKLFQELIINQTVEIIVPFTYLVCFLIAYYGPNAELLGTIKSNYWHHIPVKDIGQFMTNMGLFLIADGFSLIATYLVFMIVCGFNVLRAFSNMQKEYWFLFAVNTAYTINMVSY